MLQDDASSNPDDLEREYFEKFERRNWTFSLGEGKWGVRINPVSFGLSVLLIWGFAVRPFDLLWIAESIVYSAAITTSTSVIESHLCTTVIAPSL